MIYLFCYPFVVWNMYWSRRERQAKEKALGHKADSVIIHDPKFEEINVWRLI